MKLYHITTEAEAILRDGFKDVEGTYRAGLPGKGIQLRDEPPGANKEASDAVLMVEIPEQEVLPYERFFEEEKAYREFLVPAKIVNQYKWVRVNTWGVDLSKLVPGTRVLVKALAIDEGKRPYVGNYIRPDSPGRHLVRIENGLDDNTVSDDEILSIVKSPI